MSANKHATGWKPNKKNLGKPLYQPILETLAVPLPASVDLRSQDTAVPIYNQGSLNSCTANALAAAYAFTLKASGNPVFNPSRLFIYYYQTFIEGTIGENQGASIEDGVASINCAGVCPESDWSYNQSPSATPSQNAQTAASSSQSIATSSIYSISNTTPILQALSENHPVVFGLAIDQTSFETAPGGVIPMPQNLTGLHAVMAVGYNSDYIIFRNSWGSNWGDKGYGYLPLSYINTPTSYQGLTHLTSDWTVVTGFSWGSATGVSTCP
jgi:C1A family cysteine protease